MYKYWPWKKAMFTEIPKYGKKLWNTSLQRALNFLDTLFDQNHQQNIYLHKSTSSQWVFKQQQNDRRINGFLLLVWLYSCVVKYDVNWKYMLRVPLSKQYTYISITIGTLSNKYRYNNYSLASNGKVITAGIPCLVKVT